MTTLREGTEANTIYRDKVLLINYLLTSAQSGVIRYSASLNKQSTTAVPSQFAQQIILHYFHPKDVSEQFE